MYKLILTTVAAAFFISCGPVKSALQSGLEKKFKQGWMQIGQTQTVCNTFDYFPEGGIRSFACHGVNFLNFEELNHAIGPVYLSGPHSERSLSLNVKGDFGRYNPEFVERLTEAAIPARDDQEFREATRGIYDQYVKNLARIHFITYKKIQSLPEWRDREIRKYRETMASNQSFDYEPYFFFMNPYYPQRDQDFLWKNGFDGGYSGNVVKTAVAFWLRRHMDGTADEFYEGLEELISVYDEKFLYTEP